MESQCEMRAVPARYGLLGASGVAALGLLKVNLLGRGFTDSVRSFWRYEKKPSPLAANKDKGSKDSMQPRRTCTSKLWNQNKLRSSNCKKLLRSEMRPFRCCHTWYKCIWTWTMLQLYAAQTGLPHSTMHWRKQWVWLWECRHAVLAFLAIRGAALLRK